eukprot:tig00021127_g18841.t1
MDDDACAYDDTFWANVAGGIRYILLRWRDQAARVARWRGIRSYGRACPRGVWLLKDRSRLTIKINIPAAAAACSCGRRSTGHGRRPWQLQGSRGRHDFAARVRRLTQRRLIKTSPLLKDHITVPPELQLRCRNPVESYSACFCTRDIVCNGCSLPVILFHRNSIPPTDEADPLEYVAAIEDYLDNAVQALGPEHALSAACAIYLGRLHYAIESRVPQHEDRTKAAVADEALRLYELALALYAGSARLRAASNLRDLACHAKRAADLCMSRDNSPGVIRALVWMLSFLQEIEPLAHEEIVTTEYTLSSLLVLFGHIDSAEAYFRAAFLHDREQSCEAGKEAVVAQLCCARESSIVAIFARLVQNHLDAGRSQHALEVGQMLVASAERVCSACVARGDLERAAMGLANLWHRLNDLTAAEAIVERLVSETERRLGPAHLRVGSALMNLARCQLAADKPLELVEINARRGWAILESALGPTHPDVGEHLVFLSMLYARAPHLDPSMRTTTGMLVYDWARANKRPPPGTLMSSEDLKELGCEVTDEPDRVPKSRLSNKLEQRRREREERQRAEEERARARREAERAERAARDAADREAARGHVEGARWAPARKLLDALLRARTPPATAPAATAPEGRPQRSPGDFEARLLRIRCMAGAGQLAEAGREAEKAERELAGSGVEADALRRVQEQQRHITAELQRREEAKRKEEAKRREKEAEERRRLDEQRREQERQAELQRQQQLWREEQERKEARRREQERRQEERRREEARAREKHLREEEERQQLEEARRQAAEAERRPEFEEEQLRQEEEAAPQVARRGAAACRFFAAGFCRDGARCRYRHEAGRAGPAAAPAEPEPEDGARGVSLEQSSRTPPAPRTGAAACRFFAAGFCRDGALCRFQHGAAAPAAAPAEPASSSRRPAQAAPCRFFARGACRDGARCRYWHEAGPAAPAAPEESELECAICLGPLSSGPPPAALPCRHRFHRRCIEEWRASPLADGCPECRCPFDGPPAAAAGSSSGAGPSTPARAERGAPGPASPPPPPLQPASPATSEEGPSASAPASPLPTSPARARPLSGSAPPVPSGAPLRFPLRPTRPYRPPGLFPDHD